MHIDSCPRCGLPGFLEVHTVKRDGHEYKYYRVVHVINDGGRPKRKVCYLGPVGREYRHVEDVHGIGLTNIIEQDPFKVISNILQKNIGIVMKSHNDQQRKELLEKIKQLKKELNILNEELVKAEEELKEELKEKNN
jgi:hypothetical protein